MSFFKIIAAFPDIFSLRAHSDYNRFIPQGSVEERMNERWQALGKRLYDAIETVEPDIIEYVKTKKKTSGEAQTRQR